MQPSIMNPEAEPTVTSLLPGQDALSLEELVHGLLQAENWPAFSTPALNFCEALAERLLKKNSVSASCENISKPLPEIIAFAFWLRAAQRKQIEVDWQNLQETEGESRQARGVVFQIAPANVDTVFMYTLVLSLLLGNRTMVRMPSQLGPAARVLIDALGDVLSRAEHVACNQRLVLIQYPHNQAITHYLSAHSQLRIIWGGDKAIESIQQATGDLKLNELIFPDRYSAALLDARQIIAADIHSVMEVFLRDTVPFAQQACSSPRLIFWLGTDADIAAARQVFWQQHEQAMVASSVEAAALSDTECYQREVYAQRLALECGNTMQLERSPYSYRCWMKEPLGSLLAQHCGLNTFIESPLNTLKNLECYLTERFQTLAVFGLREEDVFAELSAPAQAHLRRCVPLGQALQFSHHWDGVNLLEALTQSTNKEAI